jgi:uncharacterized protein
MDSPWWAKNAPGRSRGQLRQRFRYRLYEYSRLGASTSTTTSTPLEPNRILISVHESDILYGESISLQHARRVRRTCRRALVSILGSGAPPGSQIMWGAVIGLSVSIPIVAAILFLPIFSRLREHSLARSRMIDLRNFNPIWLSLFAGIGEEILFRGAIQPLLSLWLTSAIFALGHIQPSQYRSLNAGTIWYASFVFLISLLLGLVYSRLGLITAMAVHTTGDLVGFLSLRWLSRTAPV